MMVRSKLARLAPIVFLFFAARMSEPPAAQAADPPRTTVHVRPEDMPAAEAALKKAAAGRKLVGEKKPREAVKMIDEALVELERTTGPDSPYSTSNRAVVIALYEELNERDKVKAVQARAEAARKAWAPPAAHVDPNTAKAMAKMTAGLAALKSNDFTKAAELMEQALPDLAKSDVSAKNYLIASGILASLYDYSQQFIKGEALRKDIIAKMERSLGDSAELADQYEALTTHYMMRAESAKALTTQKRCVDITRKRLGSSPELVDRLVTLSGLYTGTADLVRGESTLKEALVVAKELRPVDPMRMVRTAHELVRIFDAQFKNAEGDQIAELACTIAMTANQPAALEEAEPDCIRASIAKRDMKAAGAIAARRFARTESRFGSSPHLFAAAAHELARVRWAEGKKDEATGLATRGAEAQETYLARILEVSGDTQKRAQLGLIASEAYDLLSMGGNGEGGGPAQVRLALETILRRKGRALDASADAARVVRLFDKPGDKALAQRQVELRRQIAALGLRGGGASDVPGLDSKAFLAKLEAEHDEIGNKLAAASPLYRAQARPVTIDAVQAAIPDDSALVEYVYYHLRDTTSPAFATKEVRFAAFVLHRTGEPVVVDLGDAVPIGRSINKLRVALSEHGDVLPHGKQVYDLVVAPIAKHLRPTDKRLLVSPDDDLNLVPFAALIDGRGRFLVEDYELTYLTSGRDLLRIAAATSQRVANGKPVVFGDPAFDGAATGASTSAATSTSRAGDLDNAKFPPLPGTAEESKAIAELVGATRFTQGEATKSRLFAVTSPVVLHVATHGFFLKKERTPAGAQKSTRALEYDPGSPIVLPPRSENPLVRSGLALAGANQRTTADGILTAFEASSMNLEGTKLVVLSACETGVGETEVGDGVYGLRRSLVVAGSESQLMSLWKVDDEATRDLMVALYRDLKAGTGRAAALRKVQLSMLARKETQHPYFWAAFTPSGAWTPMQFELQSSSTNTSAVAKDRPASSTKHERDDYEEPSYNGVYLGVNFVTTTNLRDQPDREGALLSLHIEHSLLSSKIGRGKGFGLHDGVLLSLLAGFRTSSGVPYTSGEDEGGIAAGFRSGYEIALGYRGTRFHAFAGGQAMYSTFIVGDARTYGSTLPLIGFVGLRTGDATYIGLRGQYGRWLVDQETASVALSIDLDGLVLRGGLEELKMPASVSLDGDDLRASARRQVSTIGSFALGGRF